MNQEQMDMNKIRGCDIHTAQVLEKRKESQKRYSKK